MKPSPPWRRTWRLALGVSAAAFGSVAWDQAHWWAANPDLAFGFLAPVFCAVVVWDRRRALAEELRALQSSEARRARGPWGRLLTACAGLLVLGGGLGVWLGVSMDADSPMRVPAAAFVHTVGSIGLVAGLLFLCLPAPPTAAPAPGWLADSRLRVLRHFVFPLGVWLLTTPPLGVVESGLSGFFQARITSLVASLFALVGAPVVREGNVLVFPTGRLGIAEACAGLRSLTGSIFAGAFLGAICLRGWAPKLALVGAAVVMAVVANFVRSLFLAALSIRYGPASIEGFLHDATGYAVLAGTAMGLLLLVRLIRWVAGLRRAASEEAQP